MANPIHVGKVYALRIGYAEAYNDPLTAKQVWAAGGDVSSSINSQRLKSAH